MIMLQKIFNITLALVFVTLVALYAYKTVRQPHVLTSNLPESNTEEVIELKKDKNSIKNFLSKEELNAFTK